MPNGGFSPLCSFGNAYLTGGSKLKTTIIRIYGIVQGVGFRPFVARLAEEFHILGTVSNKGSYVEVLAQGESCQIEDFAHAIKQRPPKRAVVLSLDMRNTECDEFSDFQIIESEKEKGDIFVSPDIATCEDCRRELFDSSDRRYLHPFINCTQCGPRLTILDSMPYDRVRTSMGEFPMCEDCSQEYYSPLTRRYDAQPVCCNECGPEVYILGRDIKGAKAITLVRKSIMEGKVVAIKGIGGFHLCCDGKNPNAVKRLRELKNRPVKPLAVMMKSSQTALRECEVSPSQLAMLDGWQKPIILLKKKKENSLAWEISLSNPTVGVMLPYAPVQMLIFDYPDQIQMTDCLVMTSGNVSGAPICRDDESAMTEISSFCDVILSHNRKIRLRADDSVTDWLFDKPYMIRRSRGFAPLPVMLSGNLKGTVLAVGGELKNTFCIAKDSLFYPSPYVGDMADIRTVKALEESVERMCGLLEAKPTVAVCDMHPKYNTTIFAEELGLPLIKVQHHYAHILSCMAENDFHGRVIGVSFDGTGYGLDKTIWGGEFLLCDCHGFERSGKISPFIQAGGDLSAKEGWRIAVQMLIQTREETACTDCSALGLCDEKTFKFQRAMAQKGVNCVKSTSAGRLFDGVSALLGICKASTFEGEASTALEFSAEEYLENHPEISGNYHRLSDSLEICEGEFTIPTQKLFGYLARERLENSCEIGKLAYEFHANLADMILAGCEKIRQDSGVEVCALSGGVFQNRLLTLLTKERLERAGFKVLLHSLIPPNDGGIALGQAFYALSNGQAFYAMNNLNKI